MEDYIRSLARINGASITDRDRPANYPFPGFGSIRFLTVDSVPGCDPRAEFPHATRDRAVPTGIYVYKTVWDNIRARGIEVRLSSPALRLITSPRGEVRGVWIGGTDGPRAVAARRGVVLACGGFESDPELQKQYWQIGPLPAQILTHTGDGIRMAQDVGAELWHMWHLHGVYGFRHPDPDFPFGIRVKFLPDWTPGEYQANAKLLYIKVDQQGRRFTNEYPPYMHDTGYRPYETFDPITQTFPYIPAWLIFDEEGRKLYQLGQVIFNDPDVKAYDWSRDNLAEVENGILRKADTIVELAALIDVPAETLQATIDRWNAGVDAGCDEDFQRPPTTMVKVATPPFYVGQVWPMVTNTQGGPTHDARQRVLSPFGSPIPRLYAAGELGGLWGFLYQAGGNVSECFVGGRIAGRDAASLPAWDARMQAA